MGRLGGARMSVCCIRTEAGELKKRQSGCVCVCVASAQTWRCELKGGVQRMSERAIMANTNALVSPLILIACLPTAVGTT
jgi:hypothetical protein